MVKRYKNESGFILATAILAMVVVGAAVTGGYFVANQEYRVGKSLRTSVSSFYAAESGIQRELATWPVRDRWNGMKGGDSIVSPLRVLPNGAAYRTIVTRIDNTPKTDITTERYYIIRAAAATKSALPGEEVASIQALMLRVRYYDFCCTAAVTAKDEFEQAGNSVIDGSNNTPLEWAGQCDSTQNAPAVAGLEVECDTCFSEQGSTHTLAGSPAFEVDTTIQSKNLLDWDEISWDLLKSKAQKIYADGEIVTNTAPAVTVDPMTGMPVCARNVLSNWGEPTVPTHVCYNYLPVIYAQGSLAIQSSAYGQGLLLVEGDLTIKGGYQFYGIIMVRGHVLTEGTAGKIWGGLIVGGQNTGTMTSSRLAGAATVRFSACAAQRAKQFADLSKKEPLAVRAWSEALN